MSCTGMNQDPDTMAMLLVQQYLDELGYTSGEPAHHVNPYIPDIVSISHICRSGRHSVQLSMSLSVSMGSSTFPTSCPRAPCCSRYVTRLALGVKHASAGLRDLQNTDFADVALSVDDL